MKQIRSEVHKHTSEDILPRVRAYMQIFPAQPNKTPLRFPPFNGMQRPVGELC